MDYLQSPTESSTSTSTTEAPKAPPRDLGTTLAPIVLPPPDYNINDRNANIIPGDTTQPVALVSPPRSPSATEESKLEAEKRLKVIPPTSAPTVTIHIQSKPSPWTPIVLPTEDRESDI